jgi:hypothetical protein
MHASASASAAFIDNQIKGDTQNKEACDKQERDGHAWLLARHPQ